MANFEDEVTLGTIPAISLTAPIIYEDSTHIGEGTISCAHLMLAHQTYSSRHAITFHGPILMPLLLDFRLLPYSTNQILFTSEIGVQ